MSGKCGRIFCVSTPQAMSGAHSHGSNSVCLQLGLTVCFCACQPVLGAAAKPRGGFRTAAFPAGLGAAGSGRARGALPIGGATWEPGGGGSRGRALTGAASARPAAAALGRETRGRPPGAAPRALPSRHLDLRVPSPGLPPDTRPVDGRDSAIPAGQHRHEAQRDSSRWAEVPVKHLPSPWRG